MPILIVAATDAEIEPLVKTLGTKLDYLVTGVGMTATAFALGSCLTKTRYDLAINLGIAGSFDRQVGLGSVWEVSEDTFAELGAENDTEFIPLPSLGLGQVTFNPSVHLRDLPGNFQLPEARAITVNTAHGNQDSIKKIQDRFDARLESMEGAAFFYACQKMNVPCLQIRGVSNYVEKRNPPLWKIQSAIENVNQFAIALTGKLVDSTL